VSASRQPNIVFFFTDQQRWDTCGCYGQRLDVTPNLDRMAAEGVRFERAYTCQPVCGPARSCLQTGKFATETGCFTNGRSLPRDEETIAHWMKAAGYEVGYIGKWHLASDLRGVSAERIVDYRDAPVPPERRGGWDDYWLASDVLEFTSHSHDGHMYDSEGNRREFPAGRYRADVLGDWAIEYIRGRTLEKPFFLFLSFIEPHHQNDRKRYEGPTGSKERFGQFDVPGDLVGTGGDWRENYPDYLGCCHSLDENLGRIRDTLEELGLAENTLVFFTSDHGSHFRTRNREYKRHCFEGCTRIPMVACGPGFTGGRLVEPLVSLLDVPPTILAAGGADTPPTVRGRDLRPLAAGDEAARGEWPEEVFMQISEDHLGRAIVTERWKYAVLAPASNGVEDCYAETYVEAHLYDLHADPHERNNLVAAAEYAEVRAVLAARLKEWMARAGEPEPTLRAAPDG
jgi:uncharacterized sulfatase